MRRTVWAALAAGLLALTGADSARAGSDVIRLGGAEADTDADTQLVFHRGGFGFGFNFYRGGWGGGWPYYGGGWGGGWPYYGGGWGWGGGWGGYRPFWGGYRPYYGGYWGGYRPYYSAYWGGYRPYYGGYWGGYRPYYGVGFSYSSYAYPISYSSSYPVYSYPLADAGEVTVQSESLGSTSMYPPYIESQEYTTPRYVTPDSSAEQLQMPRAEAPVMPRADTQTQQPAQNDGTYPYDGGPQSPTPMPGAVDPMRAPRRSTVPLTGRLVSLPKETTGGVSQAFSPDLYRLNMTRPAAPATPVSRPAAAPAPRYTYPAYGEQALPPVSRTGRTR